MDDLSQTVSETSSISGEFQGYSTVQPKQLQRIINNAKQERLLKLKTGRLDSEHSEPITNNNMPLGFKTHNTERRKKEFNGLADSIENEGLTAQFRNQLKKQAAL